MKILLLSNSSSGLYNFKRELIEELIKPNTYVIENKIGANEVHVVVPDNKKSVELAELGCKITYVDLERRGTNPLKDFKLLLSYFNIIRKEKPDAVLTFTIKPNIYGGIACSILKIPYISNITGLGTSIRNKSAITGFIEKLYCIGLKKAEKLYFENESDLQFFNNEIMKNSKSILLPGSGINLNRFKFKEYPKDDKIINFITIGRIMKDKGSNELLESIKLLNSRYDNINFYIVGNYDEDNFRETIESMNQNGLIKYLGVREDISDLISESHCVVHPSYHEGLSNVLLEAAATGRPVVASDVPGCIETFIDGKTGIAIKPKSVSSLVSGIESFIDLNTDDKSLMGKSAREYVENKFDRNIVIKEYIKELNNLY